MFRASGPPTWNHWVGAVLAGLAAMGLRGLLDPWLGQAVPYLLAVPTVCVVGFVAGVGPAAATALACVAWGIVPGLSPTVETSASWRATLLFLPSALLLAFFASRLRARMAGTRAAPLTGQRHVLAWLWAATLLGGAVPLVTFALVATARYHQALADAQTRVDRAVRISEEHALKVFETNTALINRILDALGDEPDAALRQREAALHQKLVRMSAGLAQLQGIFVIGADAKLVVTNRVFPVPRERDFSDRGFFVHHRTGGPQPFFSEVLTSRTTGEPFFDMSVRRTLADGSFGGTVSTSLVPSYFAGFYRDIAGDLEGLTISLRRSDGVLLAGWPQGPAAADAPAGTVPAAGPPAATDDPLVAERGLGRYPVVVVSQLDRSAALAPWYDELMLMLALTFPTASGLMYIGWLALQRTRHALQALEALRFETSHRERVEESLRQSQKMEAVGQLTGGIAHDFNNLLQIISANLYLLGKALPDDAGLRQRLAHAGEAVRRGAQLATQLLAFGRRQALEPKVLHLGRLVLGMEDLLRRTLGEAIDVETVVSGGLWNTSVDPSQTENALLNLAINARDAMGGAGKLTIEVSNAFLDKVYARDHVGVKPGQYVLMAVSDTGCGMTPEVMAQAFEPFFTTKPPGVGTGLGLSMVFGFVRQSGGHAKIYSEPGHGTTMKLYLPRSMGGEEAIPGKSPGASQGGDETVLVVEDDEAVRETAIEMLRQLGYRVLGASGAEAAMEIVDSGAAIDLLFTDVVMPGPMRSPELARRASDRLPGLVVLYTSGYTQNAIVHGGRLDPGVELLAKPYSADALARRVRELLDRRKAPPRPSRDQM